MKPINSLHQAPPYHLHFTLLAAVSTTSPHFSMWFIPEQVRTAMLPYLHNLIKEISEFILSQFYFQLHPMHVTRHISMKWRNSQTCDTSCIVTRQENVLISQCFSTAAALDISGHADLTQEIVYCVWHVIESINWFSFSNISDGSPLLCGLGISTCTKYVWLHRFIGN